MKIRKLIMITVMFIIGISICTNIYALSPQSELIYEGIDVSNWQKNIDFTKVKNDGVQIVYIKASEGTTFKDPYLESNYKNAKANGLKVGFYHYLTATNTYQARKQAEFFVSVIKGKQVDCKLAMDYEEFFGEGRNEINEIALAFIQKVKELTRIDVIVYSNLNNVKNAFGDDVANEGRLWIAYYNNPNNLINVKSSWNTYIGIQYTSKGIVPGISGYVDKDKFSKEIFIDNSTQQDKTIINYLIKRGDTLWAISRIYGVSIQDLVYWNNIKNPNLIYAGNILKIYTNGNTETGNNNFNYVVKKGDCLWNIAIKYGTTVNKLVVDNGIKNPNLIYPGQILKIN